MKKTILATMFVGGLFAANAQITTVTVIPPSNVTLNVNLYPIQAIMVNPVTKVVDLDYKTFTNYVNGVSKDVQDHLTVFSTAGFNVQVSTTADNLTSGSKTILLSDIKIKSSKGSDLPGNLANKITGYSGATEVTLAKGPTTIGTSGNAGAGMINVKYSAAGSNKYLDMVNGATKTTYTASIQYTIAPI